MKQFMNKNYWEVNDMMRQNAKRKQLVARCFFSIATGEVEYRNYKTRSTQDRNLEVLN